MSVVPHTAGPLKALKGSEFETDRWTVVTEGERAYLIATIENGQPGDTLDTEAATAYLFAAAPELLAALKAVLPTLDDAEQDAHAKAANGRSVRAIEGWRDVATAFKAQVDAARAVIAKAEGRAGV